MKKTNIWDMLSWIAFAIIMIYLLLKVLGIIHSPLSFDLLTVASVGYFVGRYAKKIDNTFSIVGYMRNDLRKLKKACPVLNEKK